VKGKGGIEMENRERRVDYVALASDVIAVAVEGHIEDWSAYIGAVPGHNHEKEYHKVMETGDKLDKRIAEILFPYFASHFVWRP